MKILVTGSNGQVGHCLMEQLGVFSHVECLGVDKDELDITDELSVQKAVGDFKPDFIINAAAHTAVDRAESEIELSYLINETGPKNLAIAAEKVGATLLHISTDYVFAGDASSEYQESDKVNPQSVYGASKLAGEIAVTKHCNKHIILRTAWVFGENGNNFVKTMLRLGKDKAELNIVGDQFGGPTYAGDIAAALIDIVMQLSEHTNSEKNASEKYGVYHFSGQPHVSWFEFAAYIFNEAKQQHILDNVPLLHSITTSEYPTPAKRPANSKMSTAKITDVFGIQASDWKKALENLTQYTL